MQNLINEYVNEFERYIPDNEVEKRELVDGMRKHLEIWWQAILNSESKYIIKEFEAIKRVLDREVKRIMELDIEGKKQCLIEDKSYDEIIRISNIVYNATCLKVDGKKSFENIKYTALDLKKLLILVKDYNKAEAERIVDETLVDLDYLYSDNPKAISQRIFNYIREKEEEHMER